MNIVERTQDRIIVFVVVGFRLLSGDDLGEVVRWPLQGRRDRFERPGMSSSRKLVVLQFPDRGRRHPRFRREVQLGHSELVQARGDGLPNRQPVIGHLILPFAAATDLSCRRRRTGRRRNLVTPSILG